MERFTERSRKPAGTVGNTTTLLYDRVNRQTASINGENEPTLTTYYANGLQRNTIDGVGNTTTNLYDRANRQIASTVAN